MVIPKSMGDNQYCPICEEWNAIVLEGHSSHTGFEKSIRMLCKECGTTWVLFEITELDLDIYKNIRLGSCTTKNSLQPSKQHISIPDLIHVDSYYTGIRGLIPQRTQLHKLHNGIFEAIKCT